MNSLSVMKPDRHNDNTIDSDSKSDKINKQKKKKTEKKKKNQVHLRYGLMSNTVNIALVNATYFNILCFWRCFSSYAYY